MRLPLIWQNSQWSTIRIYVDAGQIHDQVSGARRVCSAPPRFARASSLPGTFTMIGKALKKHTADGLST
jgi:hypothetical protein